MEHRAQGALYTNYCYGKSCVHLCSSKNVGFGTSLVLGGNPLLSLTLTLSLSEPQFLHLDNGDNSYLVGSQED